MIGLLACLGVGTTPDLHAQNKKTQGKRVQSKRSAKRAYPREERKLASFDVIRARGSAIVYVRQGSPQKVELQAPPEVSKKFQMGVKDGKLTMGVRGKVKYKGKVFVHITVESIRSISVAGSGRIVGKSILTAEELLLSINGSGRIDLQTHVEKMKVKISGSGHMKLQGKSEELYARITGSGSIDALNIQLTSCNVGILGSGTCKAYVNTLLYARISGSGNVFYKGEVDNITANVSGSGDVRRLKR